MADSKNEVLEMLRELAELTMLDEQDPQSFRVRAYESAAQAIAAHAGDVGRLTAKELQKIEGIGKSTAEKIRELLDSGKVAKLEMLRQKHPPSVVALLRIQGLGPKAVQRLRVELGVESIDDLRRVLADTEAPRPSRLRAEVRGEAGPVAGAPGGAGTAGTHADLRRAAAGRADRRRRCGSSRASFTRRPAAPCGAFARRSATSTSSSPRRRPDR